MELTPLDEFPVHQTPLPMAQAMTSYRNFYDSYYFNAHDRTGKVFLEIGFGVYPNLGVGTRSARCATGMRSSSRGSPMR